MKNDLVKTIHFLHQKGFAPATSSNYSVREAGSTSFYVSESGVDKGEFVEPHLIYVDENGANLQDNRRTSAETDLHTTLYKLYPNANCILHTHSVLGTILSIIKQAEGGILFKNYELLKAFEGITTHECAIFIPIFENTQDIPSLSAKLRTYHTKNPDMRAFLISGHGMYTWAGSVAAAKRQVETIEFLLECEKISALLGR